MKKSTTTMVILGVILGFFIGLYLYKINVVEEKNIAREESNSNNIIAERNNLGQETLVNNTETRITPNTKIIEKTYYKNCNHIIATTKQADELLVNLNEEELREKYNTAEIQKFTKEEVVIFQEKEDFCNEHYLLKNKDGYIEIYVLDEKGEASRTSMQTEIPTEFLPDEDKENLETGIKIYTKKELNKILEDFE